MDKKTFLSALRTALVHLPPEAANNTVEYYSEIIDDYIESGTSEEDAVRAVGSIEQIVASISDEPIKPVTKPAARKRNGGWILLLILGAPLWLPLVLAALAVVLSVYVSLWAVVFSLYCADISLGVASVCSLAVTISCILTGNLPTATVLLGLALMAAGSAILLFFLSNLTAKAMVWVTKSLFRAVRACFTRKEDNVL